MAEIIIKKVSEDNTGSVFKVEISEGKNSTSHTVVITAGYHKKLTGGEISAEDLVIKSFRFLLQRGPKERILDKFDLSVIVTFFPEFESRVMEE